MQASIARRTYRTVRLAYQNAVSRRGAVSDAKAKREGDISSVFNSLSGMKTQALDKRFSIMKKQLTSGHEKEVEASWKRLLKRLAIENEIVAQKGISAIPQINFKDISNPSKDFEEDLKFRGVAVIKGVVPLDEARAYKSEIEDYVKANPWTKGYPPHKPAVWELYWSAPQVKARAHPHLIATQKYLMSIWHSKDPRAMISTINPLAYADRVRIRQPGDAGFALGPHVDGGSVERWEPEGYGLGGVYDQIFSGSWEAYDPWESSCRLPAVTDLYQGPGGCSMFRMFQGWLSMSETSPGEGTLQVYPLLQLATAYLMLRPFFQPLKQPKVDMSGDTDLDYLHEDNWVFEPETTSQLQGAGPGLSQELNTILHPHLGLEKTMVHVPPIEPGDFVVWHCDSIHAVDKVHSGKTDSSVLYIPVCPLTESNLDYLQKQRETFLSGHPGPDFPGGKGESEHRGRPSSQFLQKFVSQEGLRAMGFERFNTPTSRTGEAKIIEVANERLGFV